MSTDYNQTDLSSTQTSIANIDWLISAGAAAGTVSRSATVGSAGSGLQCILSFAMNDSGGLIGTATYAGASITRLNITTANSNITWARVDWMSYCGGGGGSATAITLTSDLGISLGTTGVKTASCECASFTSALCGTAEEFSGTRLWMSSVATMVAIFNYVLNSTVTFPWTAGSAGGTTTPAEVMNLALTKVGK